MGTISNAISENAIAAVVGYKVTKGDYSLTSPNLPQRIAILSEANTANQSGLSLDPFETTQLSKVASKLGAGSPAYMAMRILYPINGGGLSGIPVVVYPVASNGSATATVTTVTITGEGTKSKKHYLIIGGRNGVDGQYYEANIVDGDTPTTVAAKFKDAINAVYGSPVTADNTAGVLTITSKFKGISSIFSTRAETQDDAAGVAYAISSVAGTTTGSVSDALAKFEDNWNTLVINPYGQDSDVLDLLEATNGKPDPDAPTGRYDGKVFKPFISLFSASSTDPITDVDLTARITECTNVYCPAPNVNHLPIEVAANVCRIVAQTAQDTPNKDYLDRAYSDAIVDATGIEDYASWDYRDLAVRAGLSTVAFKGGDVVIKDLITTYNPGDEVTPQFRYVRNLLLDWNIRYAYFLKEQSFVVGATLIPDGQVSSAENTISPSQWKGILYKMFEDLADRGLIADADFSKESLTVGISSTNPDRFETFFRYKRTGIARICSTTAEAGFYYGGN
jgi:phage tail sheath gpL-like